MTELTIREKIKEKREEILLIASHNIIHHLMNNEKDVDDYFEKLRIELQNFARLICNELNQFGEDIEVGIDLREKTEEILKVLK